MGLFLYLKGDTGDNGGTTLVSKNAGTCGIWPDYECPAGSGIMARAHLTAIEGWANDDTGDGKDYSDDAGDAKAAATACKSHTTGSNAHCANCYTAWWVAQDAYDSSSQSNTKPDHVRERLWAVAAGELRHQDGGGQGQAPDAPTTPPANIGDPWPDTPCPGPGAAPSARDKLTQIITWADTDDNSASQFQGEAHAAWEAAKKCLAKHLVNGQPTAQTTTLHMARVYTAWRLASKAQDATATGVPDYVRERLWQVCYNELEHDNSGGGESKSK